MHALVICIGNKARGDDGVGRRVAELIEGRVPEGTVVLSEPQLDITMAEDVAAATFVVFVDAERRDTPPVSHAEISPSSAPANAHALAPDSILALSSTLYGDDKGATLVTVAAPHMGHEAGLSETAEAASIEAASEILRILSSATDPDG